MMTYTELITKALRKNREKIDTIRAFEKIIEVVNRYAKEYEANEFIEMINIAYPQTSDDYMLIVIYLAEKGAIVRDIGIFADNIISETGLQFVGDVQTDAQRQEKRWELIDYTQTINIDGRSRNPRVVIKADATKSKTCKRVETGRMIPEYEFICIET